ncbi:hypothetical protein HU200_050853 [Digitaria exilis]|uniref:Uncharacterized protein n=1 Tax=Digitaria exilis TaxID=1010633 RepID=A0A835AR75_9POAL|nr:hypothetical protein HU200_050853 [Digitaria exilis]
MGTLIDRFISPFLGTNLLHHWRHKGRCIHAMKKMRKVASSCGAVVCGPSKN